MSLRFLFFGILFIQLFLFGISYIIENCLIKEALQKEQPIKSFVRRRWRTLVLGVAIFIHIVNIAFMHGSGLLYLN